MNKRQLKTSIKRLSKLREVMASAAPVREGSHSHIIEVGGGTVLFDLTFWAARAGMSVFWDDYIRSANFGSVKKLQTPIESNHPCGTACCLAGTAGLIPEFRRAGYRTDITLGVVAFKGEKPNSTGEVRHAGHLFGEFFCCTLDEAVHLIDPATYKVFPIAPSAVVLRLDALIESQNQKLAKLK